MKRCFGIRSAAGPEPVADTPPAPRTTCARALIPPIGVPVGEKGASVQLPFEAWKSWVVDVATPANWRGKNTLPFLTSHVPPIWNLRASAGRANAKPSRNADAAALLNKSRERTRIDLSSGEAREPAPRRVARCEQHQASQSGWLRRSKRRARCWQPAGRRESGRPACSPGRPDTR